MFDNIKTQEAVVLIDPVSSGHLLKAYVTESNYKLIGVFTLSEETLKTSGKYIPYDEKIKYCDAVVCSDSCATILAEIQKLPYRIVAVIPASEPAVEFADKLADQFKLIGNSLSSSLARRDKYEMRRAVRQHGLPGPEFAACHTKEEAIAFAHTHGLPIVLKTPKGAGAHHVFICHSFDEVKSAFDQIHGKPNIFGERASFVLVENFVSGQQYEIELFGDGQNLHLTSMWRLDFKKNINGKTIFYEMSTITDPVELKNFQYLVDYAIGVGKAIGVQWGPCLVELRDELIRGPWLIEAGARLSGLDMPFLIKKSSDFDPFKSTLDVYLTPHEFKMKPIQYLKHASILFCSNDKQGTVKEIEGIEVIKKLPSYVKSHIYINLGDTINPSYDLATIPFYAYLSHENEAQLETDIAAVRQRFHIKL